MSDPTPQPNVRNAAPEIGRMADACANRAAEGLRTLEDICRFVFDDAPLTDRLKNLRHAIRETCEPLLGMTARDTPGDVGTTIPTTSETSRPSLRAVATAAARRAQEALRTLEEAAKLGGADAELFERGRYELYEIERIVATRLPPLAPQWRLCVLLTESLCRRPWLDVAGAAIDGGADCLQLREKGDLVDRELLRRARELVAVAAGRASVIINDRPDIARLANADGVHLGQGDLDPFDARRIVGDRALIGVSTSCLDDAVQAVEDGASYCGLGPMFPSSTKPKDKISGTSYLEAYLGDARTRQTPHLAISGIDATRAAELARLGARGVAVSSFVCGSDDPQAAARRIVEALGSGRS
ncbi:MAG: thiamine phosphate synthase [Phycisphaerae bacterium]|nr:thiamine phosphate synthase [Phycisphaerae bacterium]